MPRGPYIQSGRKGPKRTTERVHKLHAARPTPPTAAARRAAQRQRRG